MGHADADHIKLWMRHHEARIIDKDVANAFGAFINQQRWNSTGTRLDWSILSGVVIDLDNPNALIDVGRSRIGGHPYLLLLYAPDQPALVGTLTEAIEDLDLLYWETPGSHYICGADLDDEGGFKFTFCDFAEYDGSSRLTARI